MESRDAHLGILLVVGASLQLMRSVDHCMVMCLVWITATKESKEMNILMKLSGENWIVRKKRRKKKRKR